MSDTETTRRRVLLATGAALVGGLAGCVNAPEPEESEAVSSPQIESNAESPYTAVYEAVIDSVVLVQVTGSAFGQGEGTGFVYDDEHLITNDHVVMGADEIDVQFEGGEWRSASVVGTDPHSDLAVLNVDDRPDSATPLRLSESDAVVGQEVVAIGNPLGLDASVSRGIVSGVNRSLPSPTQFNIPDAIQTDAAVNPGNSGGPLVNLDGDVEGVIFAGGGDNIGFAISAALTRRVVPSLVETGEYEHSYLGVQFAPVTPDVAEANDLEEARGVLIAGVESGGPVDGRLRTDENPASLEGDIVVGIDGTEIPDRNAFSSYLALETSPGETVSMTVIRDGVEQSISVTLGSRNDA